MKKFVAILVVATMMMAAGIASATPITGSIDFFGTVQLTGPTSLTNAANATGVDFSSAVFSLNTYGTYSPLSGYQSVNFTDFTFLPTLSAPVLPLWSVKFNSITYSFDLLSIQSYNVPSNVLTLNGTGVLKATGFEDTLGAWSFTTQDGQYANLSFSATAAPVPEPGTMMLFGIGMLGLAVFGKRRMGKKA